MKFAQRHFCTHSYLQPWSLTSKLRYSLVIMPMYLDRQWRTQYMSHLLSPDHFQDRSGASGMYGPFQKIEGVVCFVPHDLVDAPLR